jgi:hypothetical protein
MKQYKTIRLSKSVLSDLKALQKMMNQFQIPSEDCITITRIVLKKLITDMQEI